MTPYRSSISGRDGLPQLLRAEWTKLRSVPRWVLTLIAAVLLTILVAVITAAGTVTGGVGGPPENPGDDRSATGPSQVIDAGRFVHRPVTGDTTVITRVSTQDAGQEWAKAGLMIKAAIKHGDPYAALMTTPGHGVHLQSNFSNDVSGSTSSSPRWLKLTRSGSTVTGYESADGATWSTVGSVQLDGLGTQVEVGVFVAAPDTIKVERQFGGESIASHPNRTTATFDNITVQPSQSGAWAGAQVSPDAATMTVTGAGDIGVDHFADDSTKRVLSATLVGLMAIVALAVLVMTSEYQRGLIRTTFVATPRRGHALAAKAAVLGAVTFVVGLVASLSAYTVAVVMRRGGPVIEPLTDPQVLRAVIGTAAMLAVAAVFTLGVATLVRRSAVAVTVALLLLLVPQIVGTALPLSGAMWLQRLTPTAGFAIQQTVDRYDTAIAPWAGFAVMCAYAAVAVGWAIWRTRKQDV